MKWKKSDQSIYSQLFCFAMFVVDLIVGVDHLCERNTNAFFKIGMSFVWLFAGLKGRNIWVDWLGWIIFLEIRLFRPVVFHKVKLRAYNEQAKRYFGACFLRVPYG